MANEKEWQQDISTTVDTHTNELNSHNIRLNQAELSITDHEKRIDNIETTSDVGQIATRVQAIEDKNTEQDTSIEELQDKDTVLQQSINANKTLITNEQADRAKAIDTVNTSIQNIKSTYLPLNGGAMTGRSISRSVNNDCLRLYGGVERTIDGKEQGGIIILNGQERLVGGEEQPDICLRGVDANFNQVDLYLRADTEQFEWAGKNVVRSVNGVNASINGDVDIRSFILNTIYPVGSIYMSVVNNSPAIFIGGKWQALNEGRVLIGANSTYTAGNTGGEFTHTITVKELPAHNHTASTSSAGAHTHSASTNSTGAHAHNYTCFQTAEAVYNIGGGSHIKNAGSTLATDSAGAHSHTVTINGAGAHTHTVTVNNTGSGSAMNNMQPYLAVYMWKRTA